MILSGKEAASALRAELKERIALLSAQPTLAVLRVGEDPSAAGYLAGVRRAAEEVGVALKTVTLPLDCTEEDLFGALKKLNEAKMKAQEPTGFAAILASLDGAAG